MTESLHTLTVAQAAEALGVSERTVWRYLKAGRLAGETVGSPGAQRTLIRDTAVDALRQGRGDGAEVAELRASLAAAQAELGALRAERDRLGARVAELQGALRRPPAAEHARRALTQARAFARRSRVAALIAERPGAH